MDTNRSEEHEEGSYSDDFEHDVESQDSPISEEKVEIKVYKSAVGSLTVQPKKIFKTSEPIIVSGDEGKSARTLSELSLMKMKKKFPPGTAAGALMNKRESISAGINMTTGGRGLSSVKVTNGQGSKTCIKTLENQTINLRRPLAHEKLDPQDIPASVAGSMSSLSISRLSLRNRSATGFSRGTSNNIRRVVAHTSIKEKSYASAKYKTYHNPPLLRGTNLPPLKAGVAKPNTNVAQRVASAKRMTIMDLKSKIKLLQDEIEKLKKENRFLNHLHHRQDNALRKWEGKDAELPRLLNQHKDEIRSLQEQLRRAQQSARDHNEKLSIRDKKILRLETELDKLKSLVHEEHLQDRHTLQQDLDITRMNLIGAEKRIREYMRHVEILEKNHKHQLAAQERKLIKVNTNTYELQQVVANLKLALRNKDRMLNYIQMRSSGRTLIRAFHAERMDRGDELLYGASIQPELTRPYQPAPLPPLMKSHSFDFGNSRGSSPLVDDMRDYEFFSNRDDHRNSIKSKSLHKGRHSQEQTNSHRKMSPSPISRFSQSMESIAQTQATSPKNKGKVSHSVAPCSIKSHGRNNPQFNSKSDSKVRNKFANAGKSARSLQKVQPKSQNLKGKDNLADKKQQPAQGHGDGKSVSSTGRAAKPSNMSPPSNKPRRMNNDTGGKPNVDNVESKELIYRGSTKGFRYEGPFVNSSKEDCKKDSTEVLYSPKSDKLSERSLSSTCTSQTVSSRSEEIISNIDILSARIRESCVLVPPPEEKFKSPRDQEGAECVANKNKMQMNQVKPTVGPAGDNTVSPVHLNQNILLGNNNTSSNESNNKTVIRENNPPSFPNGLLQPVQLVAHSSAGQEMNSPKSQQSFVSPRIQIHSLSLPSVTAAQSVQPGQFQLAQTQVTDQIVSSPTLPQSQISFVSANQPQMIDNNAIQYTTSPRMHHGYTSIQQQQHPISIQQDSQNSHAQQGQSLSSRHPSEFPYFSYATNTDLQEVMTPNPNIAIFQASPSYGLQQAFPSPRATNLTHGPIHSQQTMLVSPTARNTFPRVGFIDNQICNNSGEQSLPSVNNNTGGNKNQSLYNPSYYVNLGSWK